VRKELGALDDGADPAGHVGQRRRHLLAEQPHLAAVGADEAEQRTQGGRLARPVGPQEAVHLAGLHHHVEPVERLPWPAPP
jgi:hypothetical protein